MTACASSPSRMAWACACHSAMGAIGRLSSRRSRPPCERFRSAHHVRWRGRGTRGAIERSARLGPMPERLLRACGHRTDSDRPPLTSVWLSLLATPPKTNKLSVARYETERPAAPLPSAAAPLKVKENLSPGFGGRTVNADASTVLSYAR